MSRFGKSISGGIFAVVSLCATTAMAADFGCEVPANDADLKSALLMCDMAAHQPYGNAESLADAMYVRGRIYERLNRDDLAMENYVGATKWNKDDPYSYYALATLYERHSRFDLAIDVDTKLLEQHPRDPTGAMDICWARAAWNRDLAAALDACNAALAFAPNDASVFDARGFVYFRQGDYAKSVADLDAALKKNPKLASSLYVRGVAKLKLKDQSGADDIAAAKTMDPTVVSAYTSLGVVI
jgi:tetratricopeptide (TPR) repeat protein